MSRAAWEGGLLTGGPMVQVFMQPLLVWPCAGDSGQEVTKWPEEAGSSREGILGDVTAGSMALEPQHLECFGN